MKKRFLLLFVALVLITVPVISQDSGFSAGLRFDAPNVNHANEFPLVVTPIFGYENFLDPINIEMELRVPVGILGDAKAGDDIPVDLELEFDVGYIMENWASTLSFGLWGEFGLPILPEVGDWTLPLMPWIKYSYIVDFGDIYAKLGLPIRFINTWNDEFYLGANLTLGWDSLFGLGISVTPRFMFLPSDYVDFYNGLSVVVSYEVGSVYAELEVAIPTDFDYGIGLGLYASFDLSPWTFYLGTVATNVFSDFDVRLYPYLGFSISF